MLIFFQGDRTTANKNKKSRNKFNQISRKSKHKFVLPDSSQVGLIELEERLCPVDGCDSSGHLGGSSDTHFTIEACPLYHNLTPKQCKVCKTQVFM